MKENIRAGFLAYANHLATQQAENDASTKTYIDCVNKWDAIVAKWDALPSTTKGSTTFEEWATTNNYPKSYEELCNK